MKSSIWKQDRISWFVGKAYKYTGDCFLWLERLPASSPFLLAGSGWRLLLWRPSFLPLASNTLTATGVSSAACVRACDAIGMPRRFFFSASSPMFVAFAQDLVHFPVASAGPLLLLPQFLVSFCFFLLVLLCHFYFIYFSSFLSLDVKIRTTNVELRNRERQRRWRSGYCEHASLEGERKRTNAIRMTSCALTGSRHTYDAKLVGPGIKRIVKKTFLKLKRSLVERCLLHTRWTHIRSRVGLLFFF